MPPGTGAGGGGGSWLERLGNRFAVFALRTLFRELRQTRKAVEELTLAYKQVHGLAEIALPANAVTDAESNPDHESVLPPNSYMTYWMIEELVREHLVPITQDTNLERLAIDRGWLSADGRLLVFPESARNMEWDLKS